MFIKKLIDNVQKIKFKNISLNKSMLARLSHSKPALRIISNYENT